MKHHGIHLKYYVYQGEVYKTETYNENGDLISINRLWGIKMKAQKENEHETFSKKIERTML